MLTMALIGTVFCLIAAVIGLMAECITANRRSADLLRRLQHIQTELMAMASDETRAA